MKINILLIGFLFSIGSTAYAQAYDSTFQESANEYDSSEIESAYETEDIPATYTINDPASLPVSKANDTLKYPKHNFDKSKWKEIVGDATFAEEKPEEKKSGSIAPVWSGLVLKIIAYGIIFAVIIVVFYLLVKNAFAEEGSIKKRGNAESLLYDDHIDEVSEQDIESLLKRALAEGDFRTAVRLYYIRLLKHLHSSNFIHWKKDKTNRDYSYELSKTPFIHGFQKITLAYEIIWYGERTPTPSEFETLQKNFRELQDLTSIVSE